MKKKSNISTILFLAIITLILSGCSGGALTDNSGNNATITINVGGIENRSIWLHEDWPNALNELLFDITLSGGQGADMRFPGIKPDQNNIISVTAAPGRWNIRIEAWYDGIQYASGFEPNVQIRSGQNNPVHITMLPPPLGRTEYRGNIKDYHGGRTTIYGEFFNEESGSITGGNASGNVPLGTVFQGGDFLLTLRNVSRNNLVSLEVLLGSFFDDVTDIGELEFNPDVRATMILPFVGRGDDATYLHHGNESVHSAFVYADRPASITGSLTYRSRQDNGNPAGSPTTTIENWEVNVQQGWSMIYFIEETNGDNETITITSTRPGDVQWMLDYGDGAGGGGGSAYHEVGFTLTYDPNATGVPQFTMLCDLLMKEDGTTQEWTWEDINIANYGAQNYIQLFFPIGRWAHVDSNGNYHYDFEFESNNEFEIITMDDTMDTIKTQTGTWWWIEQIIQTTQPGSQDLTFRGVIGLRFDGPATGNPPNPSIRFRR